MTHVYTKLDVDAFNSLYHYYRRVLFKKFLLILDSHEIVEDVIQEVFLRVWIKREHIKMDHSLIGYMLRIGHNLIVDYYRDLDRKKKYVAVQALFFEPDVQAKEEKLLKEEKLMQMGSIINKLPPKRKKVFELCKFENKSYEEVSRTLGISVSTISDHIVKAKNFIRTELSKEAYYNQQNYN